MQQFLYGSFPIKMAPKRRLQYDVAFKVKVASRSEEIGPSAAAKEFGVSLSNVKLWRKERPVLENLPKNRKSLRWTKGKWPNLENRLVEWIKSMRTDGHPVSSVVVRLKAQEMATEEGLEGFSSSAGWYSGFMRRNNFSVRSRTTVGQKLPKDWETKCFAFKSFVQQTMKTKNVAKCNVYNMDELPLSWDAPPSRTVDETGKKSIFVKTTGHEKTNFTVVLACSATGEKLKPMIILKRKTLPKDEISNEVILKVNEKGWMNSQLMRQWVAEVFKKRECLEGNSLLILDSMKAHIGEEVKEDCSQEATALAVIPGGLTKILQPLDITINRVLKLEMRKLWEKWMTDGLHSFTKSGHMKRASIPELCLWIERAWASVKPSVIQNAFLTSGVFSEQLSAGEASTSTQNLDDGSNPEEWKELFNSDFDDSEFEGFP